MSTDFTQTQRIEGEDAGDQFGSYAIQINGTRLTGDTFRLGDINGDGIPDLVVGAARNNNNGRVDAGRVYVFLGDGSGRFDGEAILDATDADIIFTGPSAIDFFGAEVEIIDIDGDGDQDIIVGAPNTNVGGVGDDTGRVYILMNQGNGAFQIDPTTAPNMFINGEQEGSNFGTDFTIADINGDGEPDLVVGAQNFDTTINATTVDEAGRVYIFFNDGGAFPASATNNDGTIDSTELNERFGIQIRSGDVDGDGEIDLVVGSPLKNLAAGADAGIVYIFLNENGGTFPETTDDADEIIEGSQGGMEFGADLTLGFLDGDDRLDLLVGAPFYDADEDDSGAVFIFYNSGDPDDLFTDESDSADESISGENINDQFGTSVAIADIDQGDILVGATRFNVNGLENAGRVYLFLNDGIPPFFPSTAADADLTINGVDINGRFGSGIVTGDVNNDKLTDILIGARFAMNQDGDEEAGAIFVFIQQVPTPPERRQPLCEKLSVTDVFCDEIFYVEDEELAPDNEVPLGEIAIPPGSEIIQEESEVTVTVMECDPVFVDGQLLADITFMVQKELMIARPGDLENIPLEFGFPLHRLLLFRKCQLPEDDELRQQLIDELRCQIISVDADDRVALTPGDDTVDRPFKNAFLEETLTIMVKIKLVRHRQEYFALCPAEYSAQLEVEQEQIDLQ